MLTVAPVLRIAAPSGRDAAHELGAVGDGLFRMKSPLFAGKTLANHLGALIDEDAHRFAPDGRVSLAMRTALTAASVKSLAGVIARPLLANNSRANGAFVPSSRT